ncbi:hypothetical protein [Achromobacter xylosoxidans]|uniref:hypothetical protein n=1 Tax=Alcaligenes xylosoxydans xylosoxydans TaxID=85698 RepID=UPI001F13C835|nr:hypothetical protein [Achromobacter xylosoxidans]
MRPPQKPADVAFHEFRSKYIAIFDADSESIETGRLEEDADLSTLPFNAMTSPSREELDAKFERTEARVDARLAGFEQRVAEQLGTMAADLREIRVEVAHLKGVKTQVWAAAGTAIAVTVGSIWAAWALGFGAFESGRNTANLVRDAQEKIEKASNEMAKQQDEMARQQEETRKILQEAIKAINNAQPKQ